MKFLFMTCALLLCGAVSAMEQTDKQITSDVPATVFTNRQDILFRVDRVAGGISFQIFDWKGKSVAKGTVRNGEIKLPPLPKNYYRLFLPEEQFTGSRSFTVVTDPVDRKGNRNYSMVTSPGGAFGFFPNAKKAMEFFSKLYTLSGLEIAREYTNWNGLERKREEYDFRTIDQKLEACKTSGVRYLYLVEHAPAWISENQDKFPTDLLAVYNFGKAVAAHCKNNTAVWEFYNEIENKYKAWEYAAALKAFYLGVKAGYPDTQVAMTSYLFANKEYPQHVLENGTGNYFDIFNYHLYTDLAQYPKIVAHAKLNLRKNGLEDRPLWITESNTRAEGDAAIDIGIKGVKAQSFEQELVVAEYLTKSHLILQQLGVARNFTFILRPCNEEGGKRAWGLLRQDLTAKPAFTAFATLTDQLGNAELLGEVKMPKGVRGFLFRQPDDSRSLVLWSESELDKKGDPVESLKKKKFFQQKVELSTQQPLRIVENFGAGKTLQPQNGKVSINVSRFPIYIHGVEKMTVGHKRQPYTLPVKKQRPAPSPVVLSMKMEGDFYAPNHISLLISPDKKSLPMELRVWNLSDKQQTGNLADVHGSLSDLPEKITLNPWECRKIQVHFSEKAKEQSFSKIKLSGTFNNLPIGDFVLPYMQLEMAQKLSIPGIGNIKNWKDTVTRGGKTKILPQNDKVRFEVTFPPNADNWVYPRFTPSGKKAQDLLENAIGISFEIRVEQSKKSKYNCVWVDVENKDTGKKHSNRRDYSNISYGDWVENFILCPVSSDEKITGFGIGLGPVGVTEINYELRNITIYLKNTGGKNE